MAQARNSLTTAAFMVGFGVGQTTAMGAMRPSTNIPRPRPSLGTLPAPSPISATAPVQYRATLDGQEMQFDTAKDKFEKLAVVWKDYNHGRSVIVYNHAAYFQIIGMGEPVLPYLMERLESGDGDWLLALKYITGAKVTTPEMRGDFAAIKRAWIDWAATNIPGEQL